MIWSAARFSMLFLRSSACCSSAGLAVLGRALRHVSSFLSGSPGAGGWPTV